MLDEEFGGILTPRRTPIPAKIIFAGEKGYIDQMSKDNRTEYEAAYQVDTFSKTY